jgi:hypothetical protein
VATHRTGERSLSAPDGGHGPIGGGSQPLLLVRFAHDAADPGGLCPPPDRREARGGKVQGEVSDWDKVASPEPEETVIALHEAIDQMMLFDERKARVIEMSYFGGMSLNEIAAATGISAPTVMRDLRTAEAWLRRTLNDQGVILGAPTEARGQALP